MTRSIEDVRKRLIELNERGLVWRDIPYLPDFQGIPWGTLYGIAKEGRDVRNPIYRRILDLPDYETCGMCHVFNEYIVEATTQPKKWRDMPGKAIRLAFNFREEMVDE